MVLGPIAAWAEGGDVPGGPTGLGSAHGLEAGYNGANQILDGVRQSALSESALAIMFKGCRRLAQCIWWGRGPVTRAF